MTYTSRTATRGIAWLRQESGLRPNAILKFMLVSLVVAAGYVSWFWYNQLYASPVELYHRVWKTTADNYFDKSPLKNWKRFEHCYDSKIKTDDDAVLYANKMLATLGDPYTTLHSFKEVNLFSQLQAEQFVGLGVFLETVKSTMDGKKFLAVKALMPGSPAGKAGIKPGDTILSINGQKAVGMTAFNLREIAQRRENKPTEVVVKRAGRNIRLVLKPAMLTRSNVELMPSDKRVAHIVIRNFMKKDTANRVMQLIEKTSHRQAIVLDLRNNPGGSVDECLKLATAFISEGQLVTLKVRDIAGGHCSQSYKAKPDCLEMTRTDENGKVREVTKQARFQPIASSRPVLVLINSGSASASEMLAAALRDNKRARLIGTRSFGKGIAQAGLPIVNGAILSVTCVHYFTPKGQFLGNGRAGLEASDGKTSASKKLALREGLAPDITVADTPAGFTNQDDQLNAAVKLLAAKI